MRDEPTVQSATKMKEPDAPCFPRNDFTFFAIETRHKIMAEFLSTNMIDIVSITHQRWKTTPPEERERFLNMQKNDLQRFEKEIQLYNVRKKEVPAKSRLKTKSLSSNKKLPAKDFFTNVNYTRPSMRIST